MELKNISHKNCRCESTLGGVKIVVTLYFFLGVSCLNFNHVIIMKDFHNVFAYYDKSKHKKNQMSKKLQFFVFFIASYVMLEYIC